MSDSKEKTIESAAYFIGTMIVLNLLDALTTLYGLSLGVVQETNPIMKLLFKQPMLFYLIKVILPTVILSLTIFTMKRKSIIEKITNIQAQLMKRISMAGMLIYTFVNAWTLTILVLIHISGST